MCFHRTEPNLNIYNFKIWPFIVVMFGCCYQWMAMVWRPVRWSGPPFPRPVTTGGPSPTGPVNSAFEKLNWRKGQKQNAYVRLFSKVLLWKKVSLKLVFRIRVPKELNYFFDSEFKTRIQIRPEVLLTHNYYYKQENQVINISAARRAFLN